MKALDQAKAKIAGRVKERDGQAQKEYEEKVAGREAQRAAGRKPKGREPQPPKPVPAPRTGSTRPTRHRGLCRARRVLCKAATRKRPGRCRYCLLVLVAIVSQEPNDKQQVEPIPEEPGGLASELGTAEVLLADKAVTRPGQRRGLCSSRDYSAHRSGPRKSLPLPLEERPAVDQAPPETADPVIKMVHELKTRKGRARYGRRKCTVEPVFGVIKQGMGFRQFSLRGLKAVSGEWKLVAMAFNLKRMHVLAAT